MLKKNQKDGEGQYCGDGGEVTYQHQLLQQAYSLPVIGLFLESVFSAAGLGWLLDLAVVPLVASTSRLRRALERLPARGGGFPLDTGMDFFPEFLEPPLLADWLCLGVLCCERGVE